MRKGTGIGYVQAQGPEGRADATRVLRKDLKDDGNV